MAAVVAALPAVVVAEAAVVVAAVEHKAGGNVPNMQPSEVKLNVFPPGSPIDG